MDMRVVPSSGTPFHTVSNQSSEKIQKEVNTISASTESSGILIHPLPNEIVFMVLDLLSDPKDFYRLSYVNHAFYENRLHLSTKINNPAYAIWNQKQEKANKQEDIFFRQILNLLTESDLFEEPFDEEIKKYINDLLAPLKLKHVIIYPFLEYLISYKGSKCIYKSWTTYSTTCRR